MEEEDKKELVGSNLLRVRTLMAKAKISETAKKAGISPVYLSKIESGKSKATIETMKKIAKALNVTTGALYSPNAETAMGDVNEIKELSGGLIQTEDIDMLEHKSLVNLFSWMKSIKDELNAEKVKRRLPFYIEEKITEQMRSNEHFDSIVEYIYKDVGVKGKSPVRTSTLKEIATHYELKIKYPFNFESIDGSPKSPISKLISYYKAEETEEGKKGKKEACIYITNNLFGDQVKFRTARAIFLHLFAKNHEKIINLFNRLGAKGNSSREIEIDFKPHKVNIVLNVLASRLLIPSKKLKEECEKSCYDIEYLTKVFDVNWETLTMRLVYMESDVSFHWIKMDPAGNFLKTITYDGFGINIGGPACNKWCICRSFLSPVDITTQLSKLHSGKMYFCVAKVVKEFMGAKRNPLTFGISMGCTFEDAQKIGWVYLDNVNLRAPIEIGGGCNFCPRQDCDSRGAIFDRGNGRVFDKEDLQNSGMLYKLSEGNIIKYDKYDPERAYFNEKIRHEDTLKDELKKIDLQETGQIIDIWRNSYKENLGYNIFSETFRAKSPFARFSKKQKAKLIDFFKNL